MAITKSKASVTQLTASGTSTTLDVSASYGAVLLVSHSNGASGTPTTAATATVQVKASSGARWYTQTALVASLASTATDQWVIPVDMGVASVQLVYTQPSGGSVTGFTLDAEVGTVTGV